MLKTSTPSHGKLASNAKPAENDALRRTFTSSAIGMSWQLALLVLGGVIGGIKLDQTTGHEPLFTLLGLGLAVVGSILVIRRALKQVNNFNVEEVK